PARLSAPGPRTLRDSRAARAYFRGMTVPTLVVVSGPAGCGKTTLAHVLAEALACPAICRDELKEGMARSAPDAVPEAGDELARRTLSAFFDVLRLLLERGISVVAEAAFQDH